MLIVEIIALENGGHRNQKADYLTAANLPNGWAIVPDDMTIPNTFPFVNITVEGNTVTSMTAGVVPTPEPEPESGPTTEERIAALEDQLAQADETNIALFEAQAAQEEINTAQDEALIALFEMIGGEE